MVIIFDCELTEPPSSINCFRDVTLYNSIFLKNHNLIKCPKGTRSMYWKWIKQYGAHDFIDQLLREEEVQEGIIVGSKGSINIKKINEFNYSNVIEKIKAFNLY